MTGTAIKSMKLYSQVDRIFNDLRAAGFDGDAPLSADILSQYDQYHYYGTDAVDEAIAAARITADSKVLDIGSGIGGPARHLAATAGCHVTAVEIQPDLNEVAAQLTRRCGLSALIDHRCADVLSEPLPAGGFDAVVSWLCFYHIPDRAGLLSQCHKALKPGGTLYAEDLFALGEFRDREAVLVSQMLFGNYMPSAAQYQNDLAKAGFSDITFDDLTDHWAPFVYQRLDAYLQNRKRNVSIHGSEIVDGMEAFYAAVADLFRGGNLGGARVVARKPG